ncbi:MAG: hypothetical protein IPK16_20555 [Anaerolineales bacterium]|nr:hypothetical protein [Anaerolineales bacterium]
MLDPRLAWLLCAQDLPFFVRNFVSIYDATTQDWVRFELWPAQERTLQTMADSRKLVVLKARQLGISWLSLAYALWLMLSAVLRASALCSSFSPRPRSLGAAPAWLYRAIDMPGAAFEYADLAGGLPTWNTKRRRWRCWCS